MFGKRITSILLAGALVTFAFALAVGPAAGSSDDGGRSFHGTVASIAKNGKSLTVNSRGGQQTRFVVRSSTAYEHISGLGGLSKGTPVEVHAFRSGDRWIATRIEANPGGDDRGSRGSDDSPGDDHGSGGHGSDDPPGDDHGSGGHGSDD